MPIKVVCGNASCGQKFNAKDELAGKTVKCPKCGTGIQIPSAAHAPPGLQGGQPTQPTQPMAPAQSTFPTQAFPGQVNPGQANPGSVFPTQAHPGQAPLFPQSQPQGSDPYELAPAQPRSAADPYALGSSFQDPILASYTQDADLGSLLDEAGVKADTHRGPRCPNCNHPLQPNAVLCVNCGFHLQMGRVIESYTGHDAGDSEAGLSDSERLVRKAERVIEETPIDSTSQEWGEGHTLAAWLLLLALPILWGVALWVVVVWGVTWQAYVVSAFAVLFGGYYVTLVLFCLSIGGFIALETACFKISFDALDKSILHGLCCLFFCCVYAPIYGIIYWEDNAGSVILYAVGLAANIFFGVMAVLVFALFQV